MLQSNSVIIISKENKNKQFVTLLSVEYKDFMIQSFAKDKVQNRFHMRMSRENET